MERKLCYVCGYDGNKCNKAVVNVSRGILIPPPNNEIKARLKGIIAEHVLDEAWDICEKCERNYSISCGIHGNLAWECKDKVVRI